MARVRNHSRKFGDRTLKKTFSGFLGGMNVDSHPANLAQGEAAYLDNAIPYRSEVTGRKGYTEFATSTAWGIDDAVHSSLYHDQLNYWFVHAGVNLYYSDDFGTTWNIMSGDIGDVPSTMKQFDNELLISTDSRIFITETASDTPNVVRVVNGELPVDKLELSARSDDIQGDYIYRYIYTLCRVVQYGGVDVLVQESAPISFGNDPLNPADYTEISLNSAITGTTYPYPVNFVAPTGEGYDQYTHVRVYRTLNIGTGLDYYDRSTTSTVDETTTITVDETLGIQGNSQNSAEEYYLITQLSIADLEVYGYYGIGDMEIAGTGDDAFTVGDQEHTWNVSDRDILLNASPLLRTRFFQKIPASVIFETAPGYIFTARDEILYYSETFGQSTYIGVYDEGSQFNRFNNRIGALRTFPDSLIVFCHRNTHKANIYAATDTGSEAIGVSKYVIDQFTLLDNNIGVNHYNKLVDIELSQVIALCSDGAVRSFTGTSWEYDASSDKVRSITSKIKTCQMGYDNEYGILLWYSDIDDQIGTLRLGLIEDIGKGWSAYTGNEWINQPQCVFQMITPDNALKILCAVNSTDNQVIYRLEDGYTDNGADIVSTIVLPYVTGTDPGYMVVAGETDIHIRVEQDSDLDLATLQSIVTTSSDTMLTTNTYDGLPSGELQYYMRVFPRGVKGSYLQTSIFLSKSGYTLSHISLVYRSQDKQINVLNMSDNIAINSLNTGLTFWWTSPYDSIERISRAAVTGDREITPISFLKSIASTVVIPTELDLTGDYTVTMLAKTNTGVNTVILADGAYIKTPATIPDQEWVYLTHVRDANSGVTTVYINGSVETLESDVDLIGEMTLFGSEVNNYADIRIYDRKLTESEIGILYQDIINFSGEKTLIK